MPGPSPAAGSALTSTRASTGRTTPGRLTVPRSLAAARRGLAAGEGDLAALAFMAHGIKGSAGALQARSIHRQAAEVDAAARAGHRDARALAGGLADQLEALVGELEAHLATDAPRMPD